MPKLANFQFTLGDLIAALERRPGEEPVVFDFCRFTPSDIHSYRGFPEDLALSYSAGSNGYTVETMLLQLRTAVDKEFSGYKGGRYVMNEDSALWVALYECSTETVITARSG